MQDDSEEKPTEKQKLINQTQNDKSDFNSEIKTTSEKKSKTKIYVGVGLAVIAVVLIITLSVVLTKDDGNGKNNLPIPPIPAFPPAVPIYVNNYTQGGVAVDTQDTYSGFIISEGYNSVAHQSVLQGLYSKLGGRQEFGVNPDYIPQGANNMYIKNVSYQFGMPSFKVARMVMTDADPAKPRYSIPTDAVNKDGNSKTMRLEMLGFQIYQNPFAFSFTDVADKSNVFVHTNGSSLVVMDKYIQMDFQLPSQRVYGFGERVREFQLTEGSWTMWAKGADSPYDDGTGGKQVYGVHPFIMVQGKKKGDYFGMYFRNSNAQSPLLKFNDDGSSTLSYITTGGQLEVYFFIHGSAKSIIQSYQNMVGNPNLPPFWSLGWQQASWKYQSQQQVQDVIQNYADADMPLEVMWLDIPYLDKYSDFSVDNTAFPNIQGLADGLHLNNQKIVVILDAGLSADKTDNVFYQQAQTLKILIQSTINQDQYEGALVMKVWPDHTVFIDWFNKDAATVWNQGLDHLATLIPYDGLWLDMNEATGFCNGECPEYGNTQSAQSMVEKLLRQLSESSPKLEANYDQSWYYSYQDQSQASTYFLPFIPGYANSGNLDYMTLSLNATNPSIGETQYNLHSLYGLMMAKTTFNYLTNVAKNKDDRAFILSRSTFSGSGKYTSHWLGDNWRKWEYMTYSIAGIMNMNMFGIPHAGADVCGFFGKDRDSEMCARWIQLATFYPFARAHQNLTYEGQESEGSEPYTLDGNWKDIARDALYDRYQYLRHMYTCLFEASQWGGSCFDPLFYYYPTDDELFSDIEKSFMVGGALKVSPILEQGVTTTYESYFPNGTWVNMADYSEIIEGGKKATLTARNTVNVHLRPGSIVGVQDNSDHKMKTTADLLSAPKVSLVINRDTTSGTGYSYGTLLLDKGESRSEIFNNQYEYLQFSYSRQSINKLFAQGTLNSQSQYTLDKVVIVNAVNLKDTNSACYMTMDYKPVPMSFAFDDTMNTLTLSQKDATAIKFDDFKTIHFSNSNIQIDLCNPNTYLYKLQGAQPNLESTSATFILTNLGNVLPEISVTLEMIQPTIVNIKWSYDYSGSTFKSPFEVPTILIDPIKNNKGVYLSTFVTMETDPFKLTVSSLGGEKLIDFTKIVFFYNLNIIEVDTYQDKTDFHGIMGLGEKAMEGLFFPDGVYSMWALDTANPIEDGKVPGKNMYSTHPFYMFKTAASTWTGVFTNLAAAQDWYIANDKTAGITNVRTIATGGVADIYVIIGYSPKQVGADYQKYIVGLPVLPPVFALGWNQCKWGYTYIQDIKDVVGNYSENMIPLDTQWSDIDYLSAYRDFTYDTQNYKDLPAFIDQLHSNGMHYVPIIDAGIAMRPWGNYQQYDDAVAQDIFIKKNAYSDDDFVGYVWPNEANYPDWFHPNTTSWYKNSLSNMHQTIAFDGLWLDMNEASNFCQGPCFKDNEIETSIIAKLWYVPTNRQLETKAIAVDAVHYGGTFEFDTHSLYGAQEVAAASAYFTENKKRPFIIERSSFAGMGKYGSQWLGDNFSTMEYLQDSIGGTMLMNLFGIPLIGADICGFIWDTTAELCARWTVAGAFYPFSRNHNNYGQMPQEPYQFKDQMYEDGKDYMSIMRDGIRNKYHMIRYYYTQMFQMSVFGTGPFFNPLFFEFPDDPNAYLAIPLNIMIGPSLKLGVNTVKLDQNTTDFYFPAGTWCNVFVPTEACIQSVGANMTLPSKAYDFYLHLYEGNIVPMQDATQAQVMTTTELKDMSVDFHVLGSTNKIGYSWFAQGAYINDDGETTELQGNFNQYSISAYSETATSDIIMIELSQTYSAYSYQNVMENGCNAVNMNDYINMLYIYNAAALIANADYSGVITLNDGNQIDLGVNSYDGSTDRIVVDLKETCMTMIRTVTLTKQ